MNGAHGKRLLAELSTDEFIGRDRELELLYRHGLNWVSPGGILLSSAPSSGASELLRQVYDRLFHEQNDVIPFYFAVRPTDKAPVKSALRYLYQFLLQTMAFRRKEVAILDSSPDIDELAGLASAQDANWFSQLVAAYRKADGLNDDEGYVRSLLSAPMRATANGARVFVIIDDLHNAAAIDSGTFFIDELTDAFSHARLPFVFSARRRFDVNALRAERVTLDPSDFRDAGAVVESMANAAGVAINEQTRDLIAVQFAGSLLLIRILILAARESKQPLDSFQSVERLYSTEVVSGRIAAYFKKVLDEIAPDPAVARTTIELLHSALESGAGRFALEAWKSRLGLPEAEFQRLIRVLDLNEFITVDSASAAASDNALFRDYVGASYGFNNQNRSRAVVTANLVTEALKRAPRLMARTYRRESAANLQELLAMFDSQEVPLGLIDYWRFRESYKGVADDEIRSGLLTETEHFQLPQIAYSAAVEEYYPLIHDLIDPVRTALATGFTDRTYTDDKQIGWLAAEIDSKLEADRSLTETWFQHLEMAATASGVRNFRIWLVAPEGFSPESLEFLSQKNAIGSSRKQVDLLRAFLLTGELIAESPAAVEYEITIPIGDEVELIAAHTLEEIAKRHQFPPKSINQIKTALVEACINAAEHSHSPDRKIFQRFSVRDDRIVITVSNRGIRLTDQNAVEIEPTDGRRGWGLNLMKGLMDDVKIEQVDDGTRISMTKFLTRSA